jgi:signal peptidase I
MVESNGSAGAGVYSPPAGDPAESNGRPRRWVALLLSLVAPGAGQLYLGRVRRAVAWMIVVALLPLAAGAWLRAATRDGLFVLGFTLFIATGLARVVSALDTQWIAIPVARGPGARRFPAWVVACGFAVSMALTFAGTRVVRAFLLEPEQVSGSSMAPSIFDEDHLFIDKTATEPRRGRPLAFKLPDHAAQLGVKRVVALAGDRVEMRAGTPWINGWEVPHCRVGSAVITDRQATVAGDVFVEYLDGMAYLVFRDANGPELDTEGPWVVADGEAFVLGDNRENSYDSRRWFDGRGGGVPPSLVVGEPFVVWLATSSAAIDTSRMGKAWDRPLLHRAFASLQGALDLCLAQRPPREATVPPPPAP